MFVIICCPCSMLYWTEWGTSARIEKASMDGSGRATIHSANIERPYSLVIDINSQVLYWADYTLDRIESSSVNGTNRQVLTTSEVPEIFSLSMFGNMLYFSDWTYGVRQVDRFSGGTPTTISNNFCDFISAYGLRIISQQLQPQGIDVTLALRFFS